MKRKTVLSIFSMVLGMACVAATAIAAEPDRTQLPIHEPQTTRTAPCSTLATPRRRRASRSRRPRARRTCSSFSWTTWASACPAPSADRCACRRPIASPSRDCATTSSTPRRVCSPTRTALLSGRNHHMNNMGGITETATAFPGQHRTATEQRRAARGDAAPERLQHRLLRQEPRDRAVGGQPLRADRPLADAFGLRQVLRLLRRRDRPVDTHAL